MHLASLPLSSALGQSAAVLDRISKSSDSLSAVHQLLRRWFCTERTLRLAFTVQAAL